MQRFCIDTLELSPVNRGRTIAKRRQYSCRKGPACNIDQKRHKGRCAYCRFQRCLIVGLNPQLVMENIAGFLSEGDGSLLSNLRLWHRAMFVARRQNYISTYGKKSYFDCYEVPAISEAWIRAVKIEGMTFRDFLRNIGLIESEAYSSALEISMCKELLFLWMCIEMAFNTRAHSGHRLSRAYYLDESYISNNEEVITKFYLQNPALHSPRSLAINVIPFFKIIIDTAELLHR
ncbi:hypothetical protein M3Y98_00033800 [Aphelenchoides besseyi]|nr:hypothetical protein M3Y98_00033800 [Aphelenchoides besseyi]